MSPAGQPIVHRCGKRIGRQRTWCGLIAINRHGLGQIGTGDQLRLAISVKVADDDFERITLGRQIHPGVKRVRADVARRAIVPEQGNESAGIRHRQIRFTVAVQISDRHTLGAAARGQVNSGREGNVSDRADILENRNRVIAGIGRHYLRPAIAIEVPDRKPDGCCPGRQIHPRGERVRSEVAGRADIAVNRNQIVAVIRRYDVQFSIAIQIGDLNVIWALRTCWCGQDNRRRKRSRRQQTAGADVLINVNGVVKGIGHDQVWFSIAIHVRDHHFDRAVSGGQVLVWTKAGGADVLTCAAERGQERLRGVGSQPIDRDGNWIEGGPAGNGDRKAGRAGRQNGRPNGAEINDVCRRGRTEVDAGNGHERPADARCRRKTGNDRHGGQGGRAFSRAARGVDGGNIGGSQGAIIQRNFINNSVVKGQEAGRGVVPNPERSRVRQIPRADRRVKRQHDLTVNIELASGRRIPLDCYRHMMEQSVPKIRAR